MNKRATPPPLSPFINNGIYNGLFFAFVFICFTFVATFYALKEFKHQVLRDFGSSIEVVLDSSEYALLEWVKRQQIILEQIASGATLAQLNSDIVEQELTVSNSPPSELISRVLDELSLLQGIKNIEGLVLFAPNAQVIVSTALPSITQELEIGRYNPRFFAIALQRSTIIPPTVFKMQNAKTQALLMITAPVRINGQTVAVLAGLYDAADELSKSTFLGRIGESGETYLFDENGTMMSHSRFNETLERIGLIDLGQSAIMNVTLFDPGINLMHNSSAERSTEKLTFMAISALNGNQGKNTQGYRDYRGVEVIGAWRWSPKLNMGITTEIDKEEALQSYYSARSIILWLLLLSVCTALILGTLPILTLRLNARTSSKKT